MTDRTIRRWSDEKLFKEIAFAEAALVPGWVETFHWLGRLQAELRRRSD